MHAVCTKQLVCLCKRVIRRTLGATGVERILRCERVPRARGTASQQMRYFVRRITFAQSTAVPVQTRGRSHFRCERCHAASAAHALLCKAVHARLHKAACLLVQTSGPSHFRCDGCRFALQCETGVERILRCERVPRARGTASQQNARLHKATRARVACVNVCKGSACANAYPLAL